MTSWNDSYPRCDSLWLPGCPICSWIMLSRDAHMDRLEKPGFYLARHTTAKHGKDYWMIRGCQHASSISMARGPLVNRLRLATIWRRKVRNMLNADYRPGSTAYQLTEVERRLSYDPKWQDFLEVPTT